MTAAIRFATLGLAILLSAPGLARAQDSGASSGDTSKDKQKAKEEATPAKLETAFFGGGCFWCLEAVFERVPGVKNVVSGYAGGTTVKPSYKQVCTGQTGHAEVVGIEYDPAVVSYKRLLEVFFVCHDPTTLNRQGPDYGTQYRSIILYRDEDQRAAAQEAIEALGLSGGFSGPIVTELVPLQTFYRAEKYHQDYYRRNKGAPYCQTIIAPKLHKLGIH